jgi:hypothetical protein
MHAPTTQVYGQTGSHLGLALEVERPRYVARVFEEEDGKMGKDEGRGDENEVRFEGGCFLIKLSHS